MKYTDVDDDGNATWHWEEETSDDPLDTFFKVNPVASEWAKLVDSWFPVILWVIGVAFVGILWMEIG